MSRCLSPLDSSDHGPFDNPLLTPSSPTENRKWCFERRRANILWAKGLPKEGLAYGTKERQILVYVTASGEHVYLQYPGSESIADEPRPWDFRPKVESVDGSTAKDFRFKDIWDALFVALDSAEDGSIGPILATLFYRMAYMKDHTRSSAPWTPLTRSVVANRERAVSDSLSAALSSPWLYKPQATVLRPIEETVPDWGGMSLEAFLYYNDLLAWNEDCKYYYRDTEMETKPWTGKDTGRINNLLTHVSIIGLNTHHVRLSSLLDKFSRLRGVAPASRKECVATCAPNLTETS